MTQVDQDGVELSGRRITARTILWAAGVQASDLGRGLTVNTDRQGRVPVETDLTLSGHREVFVAGDLARVVAGTQGDAPLPGVAPVAVQAGRYVARTILGDLAGKARRPFHYVDKGQMATIGRSRAVLEKGRLRFAGLPAWIAWLAIHIYYLTGFRNRLLVVLQWAWSYCTFGRGARLIVGREWRSKGVEPGGEGSDGSSHRPGGAGDGA